METDALIAPVNPLAQQYRQFRVAERILLTGHSHQAWPDLAREGQVEAWDDAAELVDGKWGRAFERADRVRAGFADLLDDPSGRYALGANTHELVVRLLSALPFRERPRVVTTDGEFHSARRQIQRLEEEGLEVVRVAASPAESVGVRLAAEVDDRTAAVFTSTVFYRDARIAGELTTANRAARRHGAAMVLDVYHQLAAVPFSLPDLDLEDAFAVGGGYKYCQLGEGNCFLRFPEGCRLRPIVTGWFAEFAALEGSTQGVVAYADGSARFAGSTYDPTSHYRAAKVLDFFRDQGLDPARLRRVSQAQVGRLARRFDALDLPTDVVARDRSAELSKIGGFLCLRAPAAAEICAELARRGVATDHRDSVLRLGPAPYVGLDQIDEAANAIGEVVRELGLVS